MGAKRPALAVLIFLTLLLHACGGGGGGGNDGGASRGNDETPPAPVAPAKVTRQNAREFAGAVKLFMDMDRDASMELDSNIDAFAMKGETAPLQNETQKSIQVIKKSIRKNRPVSVSPDDICSAGGSVVAVDDGDKTTVTFQRCNDGESILNGDYILQRVIDAKGSHFNSEYKNFSLTDVATQRVAKINISTHSTIGDLPSGGVGMTTLVDGVFSDTSLGETYETHDYATLYDYRKRTVSRSGHVSHSKYGSVTLANSKITGLGNTSESMTLYKTVKTGAGQTQSIFELALDHSGDGVIDGYAFISEDDLLGPFNGKNLAPKVSVTFGNAMDSNSPVPLNINVEQFNDAFISFNWAISPNLDAELKDAQTPQPILMAKTEGNYALTLIAEDGSHSIQSTYPILVVRYENQSLSLPTIMAGERFRYQIQLNTNPGDDFVYSLVEGPRGMSVSTGGLISWPTDTTLRSGYNFVSIRARNKLHDLLLQGRMDVEAYDPAKEIPVISQGIPDRIVAGDTLNFKLMVSGSDQPAKFEIVSAPPGMRIDAEGNVTWQTPASQPYFASADYPLDIYVSTAAGFARYRVPIVVNSPQHSLNAKSVTLTGGGRLDAFVADIEGDGKNEIVVSEVGGLLYSLKWDAVQGDYVQGNFLPFALEEGDSQSRVNVRRILLSSGKSALVVA
ncbi:MAG TPA: hypothetical protein VFM46_07105, partial [Pseudomonadales bacterium]|nr:hypothetical protein [Pseudomonadales bacterium]